VVRLFGPAVRKTFTIARVGEEKSQVQILHAEKGHLTGKYLRRNLEDDFILPIVLGLQIALSWISRTFGTSHYIEHGTIQKAKYVGTGLITRQGTWRRTND
jgi:hypothetical protein